MVAARGPCSSSAMQTACEVMEEVWSLCVVCECHAKDPTLLCISSCMYASVAAMVVTMRVGTPNILSFAYLNALRPQWQLKLGFPWKSFLATTPRRVTNMFIRFVQHPPLHFHVGGVFVVDFGLDPTGPSFFVSM